jgi:hypothetical protein
MKVLRAGAQPGIVVEIPANYVKAVWRGLERIARCPVRLGRAGCQDIFNYYQYSHLQIFKLLNFQINKLSNFECEQKIDCDSGAYGCG